MSELPLIERCQGTSYTGFASFFPLSCAVWDLSANWKKSELRTGFVRESSVVLQHTERTVRSVLSSSYKHTTDSLSRIQKQGNKKEPDSFDLHLACFQPFCPNRSHLELENRLDNLACSISKYISKLL